MHVNVLANSSLKDCPLIIGIGTNRGNASPPVPKEAASGSVFSGFNAYAYAQRLVPMAKLCFKRGLWPFILHQNIKGAYRKIIKDNHLAPVVEKKIIDSFPFLFGIYLE